MIRKVECIMLVLTTTLLGNELQRGYVTKVSDGDTVAIITDDNITKSCRLAGIDTPESYMNSKAVKDIADCKILSYKMMHMGLQAKEFLLDRFKENNKIYFYIIDVDHYKRPIILIPGLHKDIVLRGLAVVKDYKNMEPFDIEYLFHLETIAKGKKIGIWRYLDKKCY